MTVQTYNISCYGKTYRTEEYIFIGGSENCLNQNEILTPANPQPCTITVSQLKDDIDRTQMDNICNDNMEQISSQKKQHVITIDYSYLLQQKSVSDLRHNCCIFL